MTADGYFSYGGLEYPYVIFQEGSKGYLVTTDELKQAILDSDDRSAGNIIMQQVYAFVDPEVLEAGEEFVRTVVFPEWVK